MLLVELLGADVCLQNSYVEALRPSMSANMETEFGEGN